MKPRLRVLNAESLDYSESARAILRSFCDLDEGTLDRADLLERARNYDVVIVRLGHRVDEEMLLSGMQLKAVVSATTGLDHIDLAAAARRGVDVLSLKGEAEFLARVTATAEHTWALLLALVRKLPAAVEDVRQGHWRRDLFRGRELSGLTLGVIGYGRLGRMVARYGVAFEMRVLVCDVKPVGSLPEGVRACSLDQVLAGSDVVSLHVPLDATTERMIGVRELACMKHGAILINTSRGEIVDEAALLAALDSGQIGGAALDVLASELPGPGTMMTHPVVARACGSGNLLITPHIGGGTWDSMRKTEEFMAERLRAWATRNGFVS